MAGVAWPAGMAAVVPVYDHAATVGAVVAGLRALGAPTIVVDDGSRDGSGDAARAAGGDVARLELNRGKGAALALGLRLADERGFRQALTIDADGQHPLADAHRLALAAAREPDALHVGSRDLRRAPAASRFGRRWSDLWVRIAGGAWPGDAQSGLRVYPLPATTRLGVRASRYAWEVEVLVRAAWTGIRLVPLPVAVIYPADRVSHFHAWRDNARTAWTFTRLVTRRCCAAIRLARLGPAGAGRADCRRCGTMAPASRVAGTEALPVKTAERAWSGRSVAGARGHRLVAAFARFGGPTLCYWLLIPPATWFFFRLGDRRRVITRYWRRVRPSLGRWGALVMTWAHFWSFARLLADRFLVAQPGALTHRSLSYDRLRAAMADPRGCVMVSAHVGNWEISGRFLSDYGVAFNLVMATDENPAVAAQVRAALGERRVIDLADPFAASLAIAAALARGETCCLLADRTAGAAERTVAVPFLGGTARLPIGPFIAAAISGALVLPTFCIKTGWRSYATFALPPWRPRLTSRAARQAEIAALVARWARHLERVVRRWPMQWHNFFEFWER